MKYRKRPVTIFFIAENLYVKTLEGTMTVQVGNYVIKGIKGELYSCRADIFEKTYELAG